MKRSYKSYVKSDEENVLNAVVGKRLKDARKKAKLSQVRLASKLNISFQQIGKYEKGQNGLEEERRLAYVGITRAKKIALISFSMNRFYQGDWIDSMASRLLEELPEKNLKKNTFFDHDNDDDKDFEFNQDFEVETETRSPGWIRYQKRIK